jgi:hypothetical protein
MKYLNLNCEKQNIIFTTKLCNFESFVQYVLQIKHLFLIMHIFLKKNGQD